MNYYEILNVKKNASQTEIKKAYQRLAMKHHPDKNSNNKESEEKFKSINEAYSTLSEPQLRKEYDLLLEQPKHNNFNSSFNHSFDNIFDDLFQNQFTQPYHQITITFWEAINGTEKQVQFNNSIYKIKIPQGIEHNTLLKIQLSNNSIYLLINIIPDKNYTRDGLNIISFIDIPFTLSITGGSIPIHLNNKSITIKIPKNISQDSFIKLSHKGIKRDIFIGDLLLKVNIIFPRIFSKKELLLIQELSDTLKFPNLNEHLK